MVSAEDNYGVGALGRVQLVDADGLIYKATNVVEMVEGGSIDVTSLAKEEKQDTQIASLEDITEALTGTLNVNVTNSSSPLPPGAATATGQSATNDAIGQVVAALGETLDVSVQGTVPVSATSLPLPTGAATQAGLQAIVDALGEDTPVTFTNDTIGVTDGGGSLTVDDGGGSLTIDATSLPLPTGAATSALQNAGNESLASLAANSPTLNSGRTPVYIDSPLAITDNGGSLTVDGSVAINGGLPLPTGAATESTLAATNAKLTTGTQTKANSLTVGLASDQVVETSILQTITTGQALATPVSSAVVAQIGDTQTLLVTIRSGGVAGGVISFEVTQDGTNWVSIAGRSTQAIVAAGALATPTITANTTYSYVFSVAGWAQFRSRVTTVLGSGATIGYGATSASSDPAVLVSGTVAVSGIVSTSGTSSTTPATPTPFSLNTAATTNSTLVRSAAASLYLINVSNTSASAIYLKVYNQATAPTAGSGTPFMIIPVAASSFLSVDFGPMGQRFTTGISYTVTGAMVATDTTAVAAGILLSGVYI